MKFLCMYLYVCVRCHAEAVNALVGKEKGEMSPVKLIMCAFTSITKM